MISYKPFWKTLKKSNITTYTLINEYNVSSSTIDRLRNDKPVNTTTLNDLCSIYNCPIQDIIEFLPDEPDKKEEK